MKTIVGKISVIVVLVALVGILFTPLASAANWDTAGNSLTAVGKLGSTNNHAVSLVTNDKEAIRITTDQKIGIGISNPSARLDVDPTVTSTDDYYGIRSDITFDPTTGTMSNYYGAYIAAPEITSGSITNKYALVIEGDAGNVGIGTTSPGSKLEVIAPYAEGGATITTTDLKLGKCTDASTTGIIGYYASGGNSMTIEFPAGPNELHLLGGNVGIGDSSTDGKLMVKQTGTADIFNLYDGSTNVFTVIDGGNVGIGDSSTDGKLMVKQIAADIDIFNLYDGSTNVFTVIDGGNVGIGDSSTDGKLMVKQTGTADIFNLYDDSTNVFTVIDGGNVGIGVTGPGAKLEVGGSAVFNPALDDYDFRIAGDTVADLFYVDASTDKIGIGTPNPGAKLDVELPSGTPGTIGGAASIGASDVSATGDYAIAIGDGTEASGDVSTAMGFLSTASGDYSTAIGFNAEATGTASFALGHFVTAGPAVNTYVIGKGQDSSTNRLVNNFPSSLMVGFDSSTPTLFVDSDSVGIGTISTQNKLDVEGSVAIGALFSGTYPAPDNGMIIQGSVGIGTPNPSAVLEVAGDIELGSLHKTDGSNFFFSYETGPSKTIQYITASGQIFTYDIFITETQVFGEIESVTAGDGLTGGGTENDVTINVNPGDGIDLISDEVRIDVTDIIGIGLREDINNIGVYGLMAADGNPTNVVYVDNEGMVGIGETSPGAHLVVGDDNYRGYADGIGDVYIQYDLEVDNEIYMTDNLVATQTWVLSESYGSGDITAVGSMATGAAFADSTASGHWLGLGGSGNGRIEFDAAGTDPDEINILDANVGIGTSEPLAKLDIEVSSGGAATIGSNGNSATGDCAIALGGQTTAEGHYSIAMGAFTIAKGTYSTAMGRDITVEGYASVGVGLSYYPSGWTVTQANTMAIMGGYMGIGETSPGAHLVVGDDNYRGYADGIGDVYIQYDLEVDNEIYMTDNLVATQTWVLSQSYGSGDITAVGSMATGAAFADSSASGHWLGLGGSGNGRIEFDLAGDNPDEVNILNAYVGIGTNNPNARLEVNGNIILSNGANRKIEISDQVSLPPVHGNSLIIEAGDAGGPYPTDYSGGNIILLLGKGNSIGYNGKVGIGTTNPQELLHVVSGTSRSGFGSGDAILILESDPAGNYVNSASRINLIKDGGNTVLSMSLTHSINRELFSIGGNRFVIDLSTNKMTIGTSVAHSELLYVDGSLGVKTDIIGGIIKKKISLFIIDHPLDPENKTLQHGVIEGPEIAVYYRGNGTLINGTTIITLPSYYNSLTTNNTYTVQLTSKGNVPYTLSYDSFNETAFKVYGSVDNGEFDWDVKATRDDVDPLIVELDKESE